MRAGAGRGRPGTGSVRYSGQWSPGTGPGARGTSGQLPDTETRPRLMTRGLATVSPLPFIGYFSSSVRQPLPHLYPHPTLL